MNDVVDEIVAGEAVGGFGGVDCFVYVEHEFVKVYFLFHHLLHLVVVVAAAGAGAAAVDGCK